MHLRREVGQVEEEAAEDVRCADLTGGGTGGGDGRGAPQRGGSGLKRERQERIDGLAHKLRVRVWGFRLCLSFPHPFSVGFSLPLLRCLFSSLRICSRRVVR